MIVHTWYTRAKCTCGYIWTTGVNHSVVCACGETLIENGEVITGALVTDEEEFKQFVATDISVDINELLLENGGS